MLLRFENNSNKKINISLKSPAGIVDRLSEKVPEVEELAVELLDSLKLFVAELGQGVSSGRSDLYHSHIRDARENFLDLAECFPQFRAVDEMSLLDDLNTDQAVSQNNMVFLIISTCFAA